MATSKKGPTGVLKVPKQKKALSPFGRHVVSCMTGNAKVPNPSPALQAITNACTALDGSQAALPGGPAATAQRDANWVTLFQLLEHELDYVNGVAQQQTTAAEAEAVILGSGYSLRAAYSRDKDTFAATNGATSGEARLDAKAVSRDASYYWQWSTDMKSWTSVPETKKCYTLITGLTPATTYYFRFRALTRKGMTDWSQVVWLLVH
jgi:hypothetical protein